MEIQDKNALKRRRKAQKKAMKKARKEKLLTIETTTPRIEVPKEEKPAVNTQEVDEKASYCVVQ